MLSLYIHIPFCQKKCNYCSFTSFAGMQEAIPQYLEALEKEIDYYKEQLGDQEIKSIYFGGGTPTLIGAEGIIRIVEKIKLTWNLENLTELSLECNPYPHEQIFDVIQKLNAQYRTISRLRFSFGIQSMNDEVLTWAGRPYNFLALTDFLRGLRERKQENNVFNFDFIAFGSFQNKKDGTHELWRPYQREFFDTFVHSKFAESFSIYMLELHENSTWYNESLKSESLGSKVQDLRSDDLILEEFSLLKNILLKNDYKRYEVSNFCRSGSASIHNMVYWNMENYLGLGVTAASFIACHSEQSEEYNTISFPGNVGVRMTPGTKAMRRTNTANFQEYLAGKWKDETSVQELNEKDILIESFFLRLRTSGGIEDIEKYGDVLIENYELRIADAVEAGLLSFDGKRLKLTDAGMDVSNSIITELLQNL